MHLSNEHYCNGKLLKKFNCIFKFRNTLSMVANIIKIDWIWFKESVSQQRLYNAIIRTMKGGVFPNCRLESYDFVESSISQCILARFLFCSSHPVSFYFFLVALFRCLLNGKVVLLLATVTRDTLPKYICKPACCDFSAEI